MLVTILRWHEFYSQFLKKALSEKWENISRKHAPLDRCTDKKRLKLKSREISFSISFLSAARSSWYFAKAADWYHRALCKLSKCFGNICDQIYDVWRDFILRRSTVIGTTRALYCWCSPHSQWQHSFQLKLRSHWLKGLRQRHIAVVIQGQEPLPQYIPRNMCT